MGDHTNATDRWWHHLTLTPQVRQKLYATLIAVTGLSVALNVIAPSMEAQIIALGNGLLDMVALAFAALNTDKTPRHAG